MSNPENIVRGSSIARGFGLESGEVLTGWACKVQLRDQATKEIVAAVDRVVTDKNGEGTEFSVMITAAESATLVPGAYYVLAAELTNATTGESAEGKVVFLCEQDWVYG